MGQTTLKILFIDEKRITSELEKAGYRKIGAQIHQALNFPQAKDVLKKGHIDVIVINYDYASIDAVSICEHFKSHSSTKEIPVIFTSVQALPRKISGRDLGPDLFIETPVPREYFIEQIRNLLEEKTRETARVTHEGFAVFELNGKTIECPIQDISRSGILLATDLTLDPGTKLSLSFELPGYLKAIKVEGEVIRRIAGDSRRDISAGLGIRFEEFSGDSQKRLEKYVAKTQIDDPKLVYYL
ncbi:MAG: PilZ domain-containing protein [Chitinophagaceae bacterium]|nr:PilZ domain-containing protein [Oligoflexus sp.]